MPRKGLLALGECFGVPRKGVLSQKQSLGVLRKRLPPQKQAVGVPRKALLMNGEGFWANSLTFKEDIFYFMVQTIYCLHRK